MGHILLQREVEEALEWVIFFSLAMSGLSVLALAAMMVVDRWRLAIVQRDENRRGTKLCNDSLDIEVSRHAGG